METNPVLQRDVLFIGGEWRQPVAAGVIEVVCPSTEKVLGTAPDAGPADVDAAVAAARKAFEAGEWPQLPLAERVAVIERPIGLLAPKSAEIAAAVTAQMGVPIAIAEDLFPEAC